MASDRPETWYHVIGENFSKDGIVRDMEALAEAKIGGIQFFHGDWGFDTHWPGVTNRVVCLSDEWFCHVKFLSEEAHRRSLSFLVHNCPGWSMSGGPWIPPEKASRTLTCAHAVVASDGVTPLAQDAVGVSDGMRGADRDYRDVITLAFPTPLGDDVGLLFKTNGVVEGFVPSPSGFVWQKRFDEPVAVRTVRLPPPRSFNVRFPNDPQCRIRVEADGVLVAETEVPEGNPNDEIPFSVACDERAAREWTVRFFNQRPLSVKYVRLEAGARLDNYEGQAAWTLRGLVRRPDARQPPAAWVRRESVRRVKAGDVLPAGRWTVLRIGHVNALSRNSPAPKCATGWECDKLDPEAVRLHFDSYVGRLCAAGVKVDGVVMDSWECACPMWTEKMPEHFRRLNGYEVESVLPAVFGYVLDSPAETRRLLRDWRGTVGRLVEENYYGTMSRLAHAAGLTLRFETAFGDTLPGDLLRFWKYADVPMCEFWQPYTGDFVGSTAFKAIAPCVSAAHVYGKRRVEAEAFASFDLTWKEDFNLLKPIADRYLAHGVTHLALHTYTHNPRDVRPGSSFGWGIGAPFLRGQTWWPYMTDFIDYLTRCTEILESGHPVVDVLRYLGDDLGHRPLDDEPFPEGYKRDYANRDVLMTRLSVKGGRLVLPDGMSYRVLWIPEGTYLADETKARLAELEKAGARIVCVALRPDWTPDVVAQATGGTRSVASAPLQWYHRRTADADWYFLVAWTNGWRGTVRFRSGGEAKLDLAPGESVFAKIERAAILADGVGGPRSVAAEVDTDATERVPPVSVVDTDATERVPPVVFVDPLTGSAYRSPTVEDGVPLSPVRREKGVASETIVYSCEATGAGVRWLDLGEVRSCARVLVNGREAARLWCRPYRCDIGPYLRAGTNEIRVEVTSTWRNELIREARKPETERKTWTTDGPSADAALEPEGLIGPVRIMEEK